MRFDAEITYPGASADEAFALVVDPEFRAAVCEATAAIDYEVHVDGHDDGSASVRQRRVLPAQVPDFVQRLVGPTIEVEQVEQWSVPDDAGRRTADLSLNVTGQPAKMLGTMALGASRDGAQQSITGDLKVSIPMLGRKIEPEIAKALMLAIKVEQRTGREWLAG